QATGTSMPTVEVACRDKIFGFQRPKPSHLVTPGSDALHNSALGRIGGACRVHYGSLRTGRERRVADRHAAHLPADDRDLRRVLFHADPAAAEEGEGSPRDARLARKR